MVDKNGWGQLAVGALISIIISLTASWTTIRVSQAEAEVRITRVEERLVEEEDYSGFLQEQLDDTKGEIIRIDTSLGFMKENFLEMNSNIKQLVSEVQELNITMAKYASGKGGE